jgi:hypothetical protein
MATVDARPWVSKDLTAWLRPLGKVAFAGAVTGLVVGGIGGRLAMLVLRLTSSPDLHGVQTDDDFTIGIVSAATFFLLGVTTGLGLAAALVYAAGRGWFAPVWRPWVAAACLGLVGAAGIIRTDGIDFLFLDPLGLAVAMFVAIPVVAAFVMAWWIERWLASDRDREPSARLAALRPLVAFLALGPFGVIAFLALLVGWAIAHGAPVLGGLWRSALVTWIGRAAVALSTVLGGYALVKDATEILGR